MAASHHQYNRWTPMYSNYFASNNDYNWNVNWQGDPQQFSYKPPVNTHTFEVDDSPKPPEKPDRKKGSWFSGIKSTLHIYTVVASLVLAVNIGWLIVAKTKYEVRDGFGTIMRGNCEATKNLNLWLHLFINVMSTLLLTGSNIFMATYSGPTRREVDKAHAKRRWLYIGFASLRNVRSIAVRKSLIAILLGLSSIPFHFLYNSVVFHSLSVNSYYYAVVTEGFMTGAPYDLGSPDVYGSDADNETIAIEQSTRAYFEGMRKNASAWDRLNQKDCIEAYSNIFLSTRRNVILVSSTQNDTNSVLESEASVFEGGPMVSNWWMCSMNMANDGGHQKCNPTDYLSNPSNWTLFGNPIEYCLSEKVEGVCSVEFSMQIMTIMIAFNALKLVCMIWVLLRFDAEDILATIGDAAASFIQNPDYTTSGMCLADRRSIRTFWNQPGIASLYNGSYRRRWGRAVTRRRWIFLWLLLAFCFAAIFITGGILGFSNTQDRGVALTAKGLWDLGFGTVNQYTIAIYDGWTGAFVTLVLLANTPQVFLALIYLLFSGAMTSMFHAADWARFATTAQALMTSTPKGKQRGTWLLGGPLKWGISLLLIQTLLHWFVSQSFFVVQVLPLDLDGSPLSDDTTSSRYWNNAGYSPIAIIFTTVTMVILILVSTVCMFRRFPTGAPPVASTCSAAISAACHVPPDIKNESMIYDKLRWGVTAAAPNGVGHCSLAPADKWEVGRVAQPVTGWAYAGLFDDVDHLDDRDDTHETGKVLVSL